MTKIVAITGASSGIGEACAAACAKAGYKLLLFARRTDKLAKVADILKQEYSCEVHTVILDVRDKNAVINAFKNLDPAWQNIDVLINNAGLALGKELLQNSEIDDLETMIDTNLKGLVFVTRMVLPNMVKRNTGHVINIGSISGHSTYAGAAVYCATKYAVGAFSEGLKKDLLGTLVRVSLVSPGMVKTEFSEVRYKGDHKRAEDVYADMNPLYAKDIADSVMFCVTRPTHVNVNEIFVIPTDQASMTEINRSSK